jgi:hypothetical protein
MATMKQIQADRHKWEKVPGTGTGPYNPARHRLKEKYKKEQREKPKKATMRERLIAATSSREVSGKPTKSYGASKTPRAEPAKPSGIAVPNPPKVKIKTLAPPKGYKRSPAIPSREEDIELPAIQDPPKDETWEERAIRLGYKTLGDLTKPRKRGGSLKKKKKKKYSAGGRVSYQGHDGNKLVSKYYS